jgi:hypothetical protein
MKKLLYSALSISMIIGLAACADTKDRYVDLRTGKTIELEKDDKTGLMVDVNTKKPVYIYVDTKENDTIYGKTGEVITEKNTYMKKIFSLMRQKVMITRLK